MRATEDEAIKPFDLVPRAATTLLPHYRRIREIGRGEYGVVYLARYLGNYYAVKEVRRPKDDDGAGKEAYARELRGVHIVIRLPRIDGLVHIHDFAEAPDGTSFAYAMDLADPECEGVGPANEDFRPRTLASVIDAEIALPLTDCLDIGIRMASVLVALQRQHIIHRDIKPGNILFVHGKTVLADIGLAVDARDASSIVGTPGYAPPERQGSPAGDVFSLGKTLYRISTGRLPTEEGLPPTVEADINAPFFWKWMLILSKATAHDPARRYRSAKGFLRDLRHLNLKVSFACRTAKHVLLAILVAGVLLPALWELPAIRFWPHLSYADKENTILPYPYSLVKPLLMLISQPQRIAEEKQRRIEIEEAEAARQREEEEARKERQAEEQRQAEEWRKEQEARKAELERREEERLRKEEARKAEKARLDEERRQEEAARKAELEARKAEKERQAEERRQAEEAKEREREEQKKRLAEEWRVTREREVQAREERRRLRREQERQERETLAREIKGYFKAFFQPTTPVDALQSALSFAQGLALSIEYLDFFLDWANLNPDVHPDVWQYYLDRRPIPPPYDLLRPFLVSTNAPPYPYDVLDSYVKSFMLDESLGEVDTVDWSDWSDDEFEAKTIRAHLLLPMNGHKKEAWYLPRRVVLTGDTHFSDSEYIRQELERMLPAEEKTRRWQEHMRSPLSTDDQSTD